MTLDELKKHAYFVQLSPKQREFVLARCAGEEPLGAAHKAWQCKSDRSAMAMANRAMRNANIAWLLNEFLGVSAADRVPTLEELVAFNWKRAQGAEDGDCVRFLQNIARLMGYEVKAGDKEPEPEDEKDDGGLLTLPS